jgi:hypothetical protein
MVEVVNSAEEVVVDLTKEKDIRIAVVVVVEACHIPYFEELKEVEAFPLIVEDIHTVVAVVVVDNLFDVAYN